MPHTIICTFQVSAAGQVKFHFSAPLYLYLLFFIFVPDGEGRAAERLLFLWPQRTGSEINSITQIPAPPPHVKSFCLQTYMHTNSDSLDTDLHTLKLQLKRHKKCYILQVRDILLNVSDLQK